MCVVTVTLPCVISVLVSMCEHSVYVCISCAAQYCVPPCVYVCVFVCHIAPYVYSVMRTVSLTKAIWLGIKSCIGGRPGLKVSE